MEFEWDEGKRASNLAKHGVDFAQVEAFEWSTATIFADSRRPYGESRWLALGTMSGRVHAVVFTARGDRIRIISARRANNKEVRRHEKDH